jgi:dTMP kinase
MYENFSRGRFIVIDGCEGAGKTTLINRLNKSLPKGSFIFTHEPGGTALSDKIREIFLLEEFKDMPLETMFGLVWASRADHIKNKILPALEKGTSVISDRFDSSTYAYQVSVDPNRKLEELFWQTREVYLRDCKPDLYIFLDVSPENALERINSRGTKKTYFDKRGLNYHKTVGEGLREFFNKVGGVSIDANQSIDNVEKDCLKILGV